MAKLKERPEKNSTLKIFHRFSHAETYGSTGKTEKWDGWRKKVTEKLLKNDINFNASQQPEQNEKYKNVPVSRHSSFIF